MTFYSKIIRSTFSPSKPFAKEAPFSPSQLRTATLSRREVRQIVAEMLG